MKQMTVNKYGSVEDAFKGEFARLECTDNYRSAKVGDEEQMGQYLERMRDGCCGRRDTVVLIEREAIVGGELYKWNEPHLLGCNYGH